MIRSVDFISQSAAEELPGRPLQSSVAVISIATPDELEPVLADFWHVLRLAFHDVEEAGRGWIVFDRTMATAILDFVSLLHNDLIAWDVIVHCKAGISRSAAVALFVEHMTHCAFPRRPFAGFANRHVLSTLSELVGGDIPAPRALIRREEFSVRVLRDFEAGTTLVTAESSRSHEIAQQEGPIADEGSLIGAAITRIAGFKTPPPAHQVQDWDSL